MRPACEAVEEQDRSVALGLRARVAIAQIIRLEHSARMPIMALPVFSSKAKAPPASVSKLHHSEVPNSLIARKIRWSTSA